MKKSIVLFFILLNIMFPTLIWADDNTDMESDKVSIEKVQSTEIIPVSQTSYELYKAGGASCSTKSDYCDSCSIVCPIGRSATCTPGKARMSPVLGIVCAEHPKCYCK
ncbi:exported hypothetical protein [Vibrio chagasii]|nr:exported hypothetical protein [Vibrio chagasii]